LLLLRFDDLKVLKKRQETLAEFIKMKEFNTFLTVYDSGKSQPQGFNEGKKLAMWTRKGKEFIDSDIFKEIVDQFKTDIAECLYDGERFILKFKKGILF